MEKKRFCSRCGSIIDGENYHDFNGEIYCDVCYQSDTIACQHCGERILCEDNAGSVSYPLCQECFDSHYTTCCECGRIIFRDDANYHDEYDEDSAYCDECFEDDDNDEDYDDDNTSIHDYCYKPNPIFYGNGTRYFGVELEIDRGGEYKNNADELLDIGNKDEERIYIKHDGSLDNGMEIVTHPMTLDYHKNEMPWKRITKQALCMHYLSHKAATCGLHIHVNRNTFGDTRDVQDNAISRVLYFVEHHWNELLKFSRRTEEQMRQWAARYGYKNKPKEILECAKNEVGSRYTCVNITNYETVEFRMFRGTLKYNTIIATLELVDEICDIASDLSDEELQKLSWSEFVISLDENVHSELITYLKERRLYVNPPVYGEEDE